MKHELSTIPSYWIGDDAEDRVKVVEDVRVFESKHKRFCPNTFLSQQLLDNEEFRKSIDEVEYWRLPRLLVKFPRRPKAIETMLVTVGPYDASNSVGHLGYRTTKNGRLVMVKHPYSAQNVSQNDENVMDMVSDAVQ